MFKQVCNLIPPHLVNKLAKEYGVDEQSRTFTPWSHVTALIYAQLTHAIGLNDVCDALRMNRGALAAIRGATPPSRNNLSHANKVRNAAMAEALYWEIMARDPKVFVIEERRTAWRRIWRHQGASDAVRAEACPANTDF